MMGSFPAGDEHIKATALGIADEPTPDGVVLRDQVEGTGKMSLF